MGNDEKFVTITNNSIDVNGNLYGRLPAGALIQINQTIVSIVSDDGSWSINLSPGFYVLSVPEIPWMRKALITPEGDLVSHNGML